jgi:hypothetical protein
MGTRFRGFFYKWEVYTRERAAELKIKSNQKDN